MTSTTSIEENKSETSLFDFEAYIKFKGAECISCTSMYKRFRMPVETDKIVSHFYISIFPYPPVLICEQGKWVEIWLYIPDGSFGHIIMPFSHEAYEVLYEGRVPRSFDFAEELFEHIL